MQVPLGIGAMILLSTNRPHQRTDGDGEAQQRTGGRAEGKVHGRLVDARPVWDAHRGWWNRVQESCDQLAARAEAGRRTGPRVNSTERRGSGGPSIQKRQGYRSGPARSGCHAGLSGSELNVQRRGSKHRAETIDQLADLAGLGAVGRRAVTTIGVFNVHHDRLVVIHKAIGHGRSGNHSHVQQEPQS